MFLLINWLDGSCPLIICQRQKAVLKIYRRRGFSSEYRKNVTVQTIINNTQTTFLGDTTMANDKQTPAVNIEQLVNQQFEMLKTLREKRKEVKVVEAKNRELKAQIATALNLPKGMSITMKHAKA